VTVSPGKNPIADRLQKLSDQWGEFAEDERARVLCWLFRPDEARMAEAFLAVEEDEQAGEHPDLFLAFETPFEDPAGHGFALRQKLVTEFREGKEELEKDGIDTSWTPPRVKHKENDIAFWVRTCASFRKHLGPEVRHLVLVLRPEAVSDPDAYQLWLYRWAIEAPGVQRALVLDDATRPGYRALCQSDSKRVWATEAALDMPSALQELSQAAGNLDTPGGQYRDLFVKMGNALGKQDLAGALSHGDLMLGIAAAQGWFHLAVPVHLALGGALAGAGRFQEAIARYLAAEASAAEGEEKGADELKKTCKVLRMQSRLGRGSALIAGKAWTMAAELYEQTAPMAAELGDQRATLDCHRLASFSYEQGGQPDKAWEAGLPGLQVAREMDEETRQTSSFPYLGEGLMRLCKSGPRKALASRTEREIVLIAGTEDWRPPSPSGSPSGAAAGRSGAGAGAAGSSSADGSAKGGSS
jgi:hypothetical protein